MFDFGRGSCKGPANLRLPCVVVCTGHIGHCLAQTNLCRASGTCISFVPRELHLDIAEKCLSSKHCSHLPRSLKFLRRRSVQLACAQFSSTMQLPAILKEPQSFSSCSRFLLVAHTSVAFERREIIRARWSCLGEAPALLPGFVPLRIRLRFASTWWS